MKKFISLLLVALAVLIPSYALADPVRLFDPAMPGAIGGTTPAAGTFTSVSTSAADGSRALSLDSNTSAPTTNPNMIYPLNNIWMLRQNGSAAGSVVVSPTAGQVTITGPTAARSFSIVDRAGRFHTSGAALTTLTAGAAVALNVTLNDTYKLTPTDNEDSTITFSAAGSVGQTIKIIFVTAGAGDEVITFHATLVSSTGTLTLGTDAGKFYVVSFISDGTHWYEVSRTAVQT